MLIVAIGAPRPSCSFSPRRCPAPWRPDTRAAKQQMGQPRHETCRWRRVRERPSSSALVRSTCLNLRKNKDKSERMVTCFVRVPGMYEAGPRYHRSRQPLVVARDVAGPSANCISRPLPASRPHHHRAIEISRTGDHRTSFAPETIATGRNKRDRTRQIFTKINARDSCPAAHNGLVGGSSPPGPTIFNAFRARTLLDRSRMFAFSSRISLVNRWPTWEAHLVRDEGVAGSNPATPTST
jgi:hypothetical protein